MGFRCDIKRDYFPDSELIMLKKIYLEQCVETISRKNNE